MTEIEIAHGIRPRPISQALFLFISTYVILQVLVLAITVDNRSNLFQYSFLFAFLPGLTLAVAGYIYAEFYLKQRIQFVQDKILLGRDKMTKEVNLEKIREIEFQFKGIPKKISNSDFPERGQLKIFINHRDGSVQSFSFYNWELEKIEQMMSNFNEFYKFLHQEQSNQNGIISWAYQPAISK